jgi:lysozyme
MPTETSYRARDDRDLIERLKIAEGFRDKEYIDTEGHPTIGYGTKLPLSTPEKILLEKYRAGLIADAAAGKSVPDADLKNAVEGSKGPLQLTKAEAELLLRNRMDTAEVDARTLLPRHEGGVGFDDLDVVRKGVIVEMAYNFGRARLGKFVDTLAFVQAGEFEAASREMLNSRWATQVKGRATNLSKLMKEGRRMKVSTTDAD